jgi:hypothetical protein
LRSLCGALTPSKLEVNLWRSHFRSLGRPVKEGGTDSAI